MKKFLMILFLTMISGVLPAATVSGYVKDNETGEALEFANIALHNIPDDEVVTGTMSGFDGSFRIFNIPEGNFNLVVTYMGYERKTIPDVVIRDKEQSIKIGDIRLTSRALELEDVVVSAEKPSVTYRIDKRVVDAQQFLSAQGGTAVDILENVPSVDVDIEGNVSLRGSENFTVMIDGRPSVLEPQDALESLPASSIENIEIMTNASAKYEAEGGAGIINLVTRRDKRLGINGIADLNAGTNSLGGSLLLNYTGEKINTYASVNYRQRNFSGESHVVRELFYPDTTAIFDSEGSREHTRGGYGLRGGLDWFISKNDILGVSAYYGLRGSERSSGNAYNISYMNPLDETIYYSDYYNSYDISERGGGRSSINVDYTHKFNGTKENKSSPEGKNSGKKEQNGSSRVHQIKINSSYSTWNSDEFSYTYLVDELEDTTEGQKTEEQGPSNGIRTKIEYMLPLGEDNMFEAGFDGRFNWKEDENNVYYLNTENGEFEQQDDYSYLTRSKQNRISFYSLFSGEIGRFGFQPGLRAEYTYREINSSAQDSAFVLDRLHLFPTLHASYQLPAQIQLMASYTRRISRPRGWQLEPFYTWWDTYNIRIGNPDLVPEMSDSYDFSIQKRFGKSFISLDAYYKKTHDKIERIQTVYADDVILNTYENVGQDRSLGIELMTNMTIYKWWMLNLSTNLYHYKVSGELYGENFDEKSTNYNARIRNTFMIKDDTRIQFGLRYRSRSASAQGTRSGGLMTDFALRQDFFRDKLTATLQVRDIFGTGYYRRVVETPDYITTSEFYRDAPMISLNLSLKINNYKNKRQNGGNGFDDDEFNIDGGDEF